MRRIVAIIIVLATCVASPAFAADKKTVAADLAWLAVTGLDVEASHKAFRAGAHEWDPMMPTNLKWAITVNAGEAAWGMIGFHHAHTRLRWILPGMEIGAHGVGVWSDFEALSTTHKSKRKP